MDIADEIRRCVVFLLYQSGSDERLAGTGFFVGMPAGNGAESDGSVVRGYLVTASHVLEEIRARAANPEVIVRLNKIGVGTGSIMLPIDRWESAPDADVALIQLAPPPEEYDFRLVPFDWFVTAETRQGWAIGPGDEVFITGLFANHVGRQKNIPIVRVGNIAAMPEEPVEHAFGSQPAYLIEARSTGGLSGSPVFFHGGSVRVDPSTGEYRALKKPHYGLLGIAVGHWAAPAGASSSFAGEPVNMGIAIVTPVEELINLIASSS